MGLASVVSKHSAQLSFATEEQITKWLIDELNDFLLSQLVAGFSPQFYQDPVRGSKLENYDGVKIEKAPDLVFRLQRYGNRITTSAEQDAWICECKLIEKGHDSRTFANYQKEGIDRFVGGDYAWAMPHAQMLAYVRGYGKSGATKKFEKHRVALQANKVGQIDESTHERSFILRNGKLPGDITLRHLWVTV